MPNRGNPLDSGPVLILTPTGRDSEGAAALLQRDGIAIQVCPDLAGLVDGVEERAGAVLIADEVLLRADMGELSAKLASQPPWSDLPFIVLTQGGAVARRAVAELRLPDALGNVMFLERPLNALTLVSAVRTGLRARRRQRQVRDYLASQDQANAALTESEARFRSVADSAPVLIWVAGVDKGRTWFNRPWLRFTGRTLERELASDWADRVYPDDTARCAATYAENFDRHVPFRMDYRMRRADGAWRVIDDNGVPRYSESGAFLGYIGSCIDVTEQRQAEAALRASEERFRQIAETVEDVFWIVDMEPGAERVQVLYVSPAFERIWGHTVDTLRSKPSTWFKGIHEDDRAAVTQAFMSRALSGRYEAEFRVVRPDGSMRWVRDRGFPIRGGSGMRVAGITSDITVRHHMQEALQELNATLEARVAERTAALAASEAERRNTEAALAQAQKMEAVGQLTGGIAHDFNNLLTAIMGSLELLRRRVESDPRAVRLADGAAQAAARGAKLTAQMLAFSRSQKLDLHPVDVDALVSGMEDLLPRTIGQLVQVSATVGGAGWTRADANQLELAVLNLLINARDATPDGGRITLATRTLTLDGTGLVDLLPGQYAEISVTDTGSGMTPEVLTRAFEPFFTTKGVGKGTGLGLAQVYGIARQCGGDVRIDSTVGKGTTVRILLPSAQAPQPAMRTAVAADQVVPCGAGQPVLLVDDDSAVRAVLAEGLEAHGFHVLQAADGPAALALLEAGSIVDAAVMDFAMPGMTGAELAQHARRLRPDLPVVFASGYAETAALDAVPGAVFLHKPIAIADLASAVRAALSA